MKNLTTILLLFFVPTILIGQNLKALDEKYGFREAKFEMPLDSFKNFVDLAEGFYKSTNEDLKLGEYTLDKVTYRFYKGQLSGIIIETKGYTNSVGFLKILQEAYGKGYKSNRYIEEYNWFGQKVDMSYDQNSITDNATIIIYCNKLVEQEKKDKKKATSEAAKKL